MRSAEQALGGGLDPVVERLPTPDPFDAPRSPLDPPVAPMLATWAGAQDGPAARGGAGGRVGPPAPW